MGSCASVHKGSQESAMKLGLSFESKTDMLMIPPSPIKEKLANGGHAISQSRSPFSLKDTGSKEEAFFDSQAWLDSDCEDDYYSVKGDFTPSCGNTPVHQNFPLGTPRVNKALEGRPPEPSPTGKKKKLVELFRDSLSEDQYDEEQYNPGNPKVSNGKIEDLPSKSGYNTPHASGASSLCNSERTANGDNLMDKEKRIRSVQCCLPSLLTCRSFSERKKKMSPAISVNDKP